MLLDFKLFHKAIGVKTMWYWPENMPTDQWKRIEGLEMHPCLYGQLIYDKAAKSIQW